MTNQPPTSLSVEGMGLYLAPSGFAVCPPFAPDESECDG